MRLSVSKCVVVLRVLPSLSGIRNFCDKRHSLYWRKKKMANLGLVDSSQMLCYWSSAVEAKYAQ